MDKTDYRETESVPQDIPVTEKAQILAQMQQVNQRSMMHLNITVSGNVSRDDLEDLNKAIIGALQSVTGLHVESYGSSIHTPFSPFGIAAANPMDGRIQKAY